MISYKWAIFASLLGIAGCGAPEFHSSSSFNNGKPTAPANESALANGGGAQSGDQTAASCPGVVPHGDHQACDAADKQVADAKVAAPAPSAAAPGEPAAAAPAAPAAAPAPADQQAATATTTGAATATSTSVATATGTGVATDPNLVAFDIVDGTGAKGYNTAATPLTVKVGQTLRLFNKDKVPHRLHTGGAPCPHQPNVTQPGAFFDCVITQAIDATGNAAVYDHIAGPTSQFFLKAVP